MTHSDFFASLVCLALPMIYVGSIALGYFVGERAKGRGAWGAMLSAILGPLGVALVLAFNDHRRKCPACLSVVPVGATKCGGCGTDMPLVTVESVPLPPLPPAIVHAEPPGGTQTTHCEGCGKRIRYPLKYAGKSAACPACGMLVLLS